MEPSGEYFRAVVDSLTEQIVVIDRAGVIEYVNHAWTQFGDSNGCGTNDGWLGVNYLGVCNTAVQAGDGSAKEVADGIRRVIEGKAELFCFEYPCHSNDNKRWFMMRVTPLYLPGGTRYVISHQDITDRKLAEDEMKTMALVDGLTGVANRRHFSTFFDREWRRCERLKQSLSVVLLDIDYFKLFNDQYGHLGGDDCLKAVANAIRSFAKRPGDLCARYGGEEFAIILGNTDVKGAETVADAVLARIQDLAIPHSASPISTVVTASLGVAAAIPGPNTNQAELLRTADSCLYEAKRQGRNRICAHAELRIGPIA